MINSVLEEIGLTRNETKIYMALLELGKSTSGEILNHANLKTGKIYETLESLKIKGLISEISEGRIRKFTPANPKRIYDYLEEKQENIKKQEKAFSGILPNILEKMNNKKEETKVEVFFGIKGAKSVSIKEIDRYSKEGTIRIFGIRGRRNHEKKYYDFFINNVYPKRVASKVKIKKINAEDARKDTDFFEKGAKIKFLPYASPVLIAIIKDLTMIEIESPNHIFITIESEEVAKSFIQQFEFMWKIAKK